MFYCLRVLPFNIFKRQIKVINKRSCNIILARKNIFGALNTKRLIKRFGNTFVLENGFYNDDIRPYPTQDFINSTIASYINYNKSEEPIIKNDSGEFLKLLLPTIYNRRTVYIKTDNKNEFFKLAEEALKLYGTEPSLIEGSFSIDNDRLIDIDAYYHKLKEPLITDDKLLRDLDALQLKAAFAQIKR